jgi:DNA-binding HxlR family transcriptional regulator
MGKRSYDQHCTVARALDVVGERWTLLLARELMTGPKRFKDLLGGLPGIGTNLLAARLKALEEQGVVRRAMLPPPAGTSVYELTELGRELEPVIVSLSRWGAKLVAEPRDGDQSRPAWAAMALRSLFEPGSTIGVRETYEFRIDGEAYSLRIDDGAIRAGQGQAESPDLVIVGAAHTFLSITAGQLTPENALASGGIQIHGDGEAQARCLEMLGAACQPVG